jgi:hypothetical protein
VNPKIINGINNITLQEMIADQVSLSFEMLKRACESNLENFKNHNIVKSISAAHPKFPASPSQLIDSISTINNLVLSVIAFFPGQGITYQIRTLAKCCLAATQKQTSIRNLLRRTHSVHRSNRNSRFKDLPTFWA